jgi:hypothetical protein
MIHTVKSLKTIYLAICAAIRIKNVNTPIPPFLFLRPRPYRRKKEEKVTPKPKNILTGSNKKKMVY